MKEKARELTDGFPGFFLACYGIGSGHFSCMYSLFFADVIKYFIMDFGKERDMGDFSGLLQEWLNQPHLNKDLREELLTLSDEKEIEDRFYKDLEFGTGGLRGLLGAGINRMNIYTVRKTSQGFADYINAHYGKGSQGYKGQIPAIAIAYDSRKNSRLFALEAACVFAANDIKAYIYPELMPTPALSFAVRHYNCCGGVMITASHNPAQYNGYKVYNEEGCQLTLEAAGEVLNFINHIGIFEDVKTIGIDLDLTLEERSVMALALSDDSGTPMIEVISEAVGQAYLDRVYEERMNVAGCDGLSVVYTPLNGTGYKPITEILSRISVKDVILVEEQQYPDDSFRTCPYPNPEKKEALALGLDLCNKLKMEGRTPDLLLATDPDCDRVGVAVRHKGKDAEEEEFVLLSGNEMGTLLLDFICQKKIPMPDRPLAIKTIVSSSMSETVAKTYGVEVQNVLTGFKFIGEQIGLLERAGEEKRFIFGFEESCGYLAGTYVRDKDAVVATMLLCEAAAYYKTAGKTLVGRLAELYHQHGYYINDLMEFEFPGAVGMKRMTEILSGLRAEALSDIAGKKVIQIADYLLSKRRIIRGESSCVLSAGILPIALPKSDVLEYVLEGKASVIIRPSGTEPKLKVYLSAKGETKAEGLGIIEAIKRDLEVILRP